MARYRLILAPCDATRKESWGKTVGEGDSILALWDKVGWRGFTDADQVLKVVDSRTGKEMSEEEYAALVRRLKG